MKKLFLLLLCVCCLTAHAQFSNISKGDIIDINGVKGIVYQVDESGSHGHVMSITGLRGMDDAWCKNKKICVDMPLMTDETNGKANTQKVLDFVAEKNLSLSDFPAFEWCKKLGEGWYIPSQKELENFINFWLGNEQDIDWDGDEETENVIDSDKPYYRIINQKIVEAGGIPFLNGVFTSTVNTDDKVFVFMFNRAKNTWKFSRMNKFRMGKYMVIRAFYEF